MKVTNTNIKDLIIIEPELITDERGSFSRVFCKNELKSILNNKDILQINHSFNKSKGVIRGMHFQYPPKAEIKIIKCIRGEVFDVAVDLRRNSPTFLKWHGEVLSSNNMKMMFIPEGFAHGFQIMEENSELIYLHTEFYSPDCEDGLHYNESKIGIKWPLEVSGISDKDKGYDFLAQDFTGIQL